MGALYAAIVLGNHPVSLKQQKFFFESVCQGVTKRKLVDDLRDSTVGFTVSKTEDQPSRVCSPCNQIRLEAPELDFLLLKPAFKKASTTMIAFSVLKNRMSASPHGSAAR